MTPLFPRIPTLAPQSPSRANISFQTNIHRQKSRRWVEAEPVNYDGDDWGTDHHFHDPTTLLPEDTSTKTQAPPQIKYEPPLSIPELPPGAPLEQQYEAYQTHPPLQMKYEDPVPVPELSPSSPPEQQYKAYQAQPQPQLNYEYSSSVPELLSDRPPERQYRPYHPPPSLRNPPELGGSPSSTMRTPSPGLMMQQQNQLFHSFPLSPPSQPVTPAQNSPSQTDHPLERSSTVAEERRRNQKALLAIMSRESYG